jgi:PPOX class probable F420-dependent enzyme
MPIDAEQARDFLRNNHQGILATSRANGRPQLTPVSPGVDDEGYAVISTREPSMKVRHLRREPWATLCVTTDKFYGPWVQVAGPVEIVSLPEAMDGLEAIYRQVKGEEHPDWEEFRQAMVREQRVLLRIRIDEAGPNTGG